ncbi:MAG: LysM peptidoglycan-binding domain-containing protein [Peptostreptococcaceae bacterium]|nr:LysM peptidoglycan-binding domain-containing protein [Peptostreptococcaceae bacterium]
MATEKQLRENYVKVAKSYLDSKVVKLDDVIIKKYNAMRDEGAYKLTLSDPWCASFKTVCADEAGLGKIAGKDAYVPYLVDKMQKAGAKRKERTYKPMPGDEVYYAWGLDHKFTHVGVVYKVNADNIEVLEGNRNGYPESVSIRKIPYGWKYIECYLVLDWAKIATKAVTKVTKHTGYTVRKGDTLSSIAAKLGTTWEKIFNQNRDIIDNPNVIYIGQVIKVDTNSIVHTVKKGETLSSIAKKYNTTWKKLAEINKLKNPNLINPGQKLTIR